MRKYIPNTITCCNLGVGCVAIVMDLQRAYAAAMVCIIWCAVFDFLDGLAARLLNAYSPMGKELDSLADIVSFGVAPAAMVFSLLQEIPYPEILQNIRDYIAPLGFLIAIFSGLRLAKFNVDTRQKDSFIGLPVPANALFWASLIVAYKDFFRSTGYGILILLPLVFLFSYLLVSEIPMFSLKFKNLKWNENKISFLFLLICIPMVLFFKEESPAFIIVWYIVLSVLTQWRRIA